MSKIEVRPNKAGKWYYRVKGVNGEIMAVSQAYASKSNAVRAVEDLRDNMACFTIVIDGGTHPPAGG